MRKREFAKAGSILFIGEIITRTLGFLYLSPLENINPDIGRVSAYLMQPYLVFLTFAILGLSNVLLSRFSKVIEEEDKLNEEFANALTYILIVSISSAVLLLVFAPSIIGIISYTNISYNFVLARGLRILAIAVPFFAINILLKCIMFAKHHYTTVSVTYVTEQVLKIAIILPGSYFVCNTLNLDVSYTAIILALGTTLSVISTTLIMLISTKMNDILSFFNAKKVQINALLMRILFVDGFVFFINGLFILGFTLVDLLLFERQMIHSSYSVDQVSMFSSIYFSWSWKIVSLAITFGTVFITLMNRFVSTSPKAKKIREFSYIVDLVLIYSLLATVFFLTIGSDFYNFFYGPSLEESYAAQVVIRTQGLLVPVYILRSLFSVYSLINNRKLSIIVSVGVMFIIKIVLSPLLFNVYILNGYIYASMIATIVSLLILFFMDLKIYNFNFQEIINKAIIIVKFAVIFLIVSILYSFMPSAITSTFIIFIIKSAILLLLTLLFFLKEVIQYKKQYGGSNEER
ncbi:MAG: hypothetical protein ACK5HS_02850 [Mycoplasmatales bacterium]